MIRATAGSALRWTDAHPVRSVLVGYLASRAVVVLALTLAALAQTPAGVGHLHPGLFDMFGLWDGQWYARIVEHGYPVEPPVDAETGKVTFNAWAFYPLMPMLMWPLSAIGVPVPLAGALLGLLLGALAALLAHRVLLGTGPTTRRRRRWALLGVGLWCLHPATVVLLQPYSEALAAALLFGALAALQQRRYLLVAGLALLLGLTRAVAPVLAVVVLVHVVLRWRADRRAGRRPLDGDRGRLCALLAALGVSSVLWPAIGGLVTGIPDVFLQSQAAWGQDPDSGPFRQWLHWAYVGSGALGVLVLVGLVAAAISLVVGRFADDLTPEAKTFGVVYPVYLLAVVRPITSMWRFLLLDLPLAGVLAALTLRAGSRRPAAVLRRGSVVLVLLALGVIVWAMTLWTYEPWGSAPP